MSKDVSGPRKPRIAWVYSTLPANIAIGPVGTFVALYLIQLNGSVQGTVFVAAAATLFNAISIPSAILWGFVTDRLHLRKLMIVPTYTLTGIFLLSFLVANSNAGILLVYSLISFVSAASATPLNMLIMESEPKNQWASGFAKLSLVSSAGATVGYALSTVWAQFLPVTLLVIPFGLLSLTSSVMAVLLVREPSFVFEREVAVLQRPSFFHRLLSFPMIFLNVPRIQDFERVFRGLRNEMTSYLPLLYLSIVCFYVASGLFNTALVPALAGHQIPQSEVYVVNLVALVAQIISFRYAGKYIARRSLSTVASQGLLLRGVCYTLFGVFAFVLSGRTFVVPALLLFPLSSGIAYGLFYTASNTLIFNSIRGSHQGSSLGVYSAIVGVSTTIGSVFAGVVSVYVGFVATFVLAGALTVAAALITIKLPPSP
jgi:MFS family permease